MSAGGACKVVIKAKWGDVWESCIQIEDTHSVVLLARRMIDDHMTQFLQIFHIKCPQSHKVWLGHLGLIVEADSSLIF